MRLWHYKLIENGLLPKSQLLAQWRELNSIFKNQNKHILINYIYDYGKGYLYNYTLRVIEELKRREYDIHSLTNFNNYFSKMIGNKYFIYHDKNAMFEEHNNEYLTVCYWNLREKYLRGQKDFSADLWQKIEEFYKKEIKGE